MKLKYNFLAISFLGAMAVSCDPMEDIYNEIDAEENVIVKSEEEYILTKADYEFISNIAKKNAIDKNDTIAAEDVKKQLAFNDSVTAEEYVPGLLARIYPSWGKGSTAGVTYTNRLPVNKDSKLSHYKGIDRLEVKYKDYESIWAEDGVEGANYFAPKHPANELLPTMIAKAFAEAKQYDKVLVDYVSAEEDPSVTLGDDLYAEDLNSVENKKPISIEGWTTIQLIGDRAWQGKVRNENGYAEIGSFKANGKQESVLVTPKVNITSADASFTFDLVYGHYAGDCLSVYVSDQFDGTTFDASKWTELTKYYKFPKGDPDGYTKLTNVGNASLSSFSGKTVQFAFVYKGDGSSVTTTVQVDNVKVTTAVISHPTTKKFTTLYQFDGSNWGVAELDKDVIVLSPEDYDAMGKPGRYDNFSDSEKASNYLPQYLKLNFPYAQSGESVIIIYKFHKGSDTRVYSDEYKYDGTWAYVPGIQFETCEKVTFFRTEKGWIFDPTVFETVSEEDYMFLVKWVTENKPGYLDKVHPDNTEYYFGASSYYKNFNTDISKRREEIDDTDNLFSKDDDKKAKEAVASQLQKAVTMILEKNHPNEPTQKGGVDLYFKISCKVYPGVKPDLRYTYKFKSLGEGKFELEGEPVIENW